MEFDLELRHAAQVIQRVQASIAAFEPTAGRGPKPVNDENRGIARQQVRRAELLRTLSSGEEDGRADQGREILGPPFLTSGLHEEASSPQASASASAAVRDEQKYAATAFVMGAVLLVVGLTFLALAVVDARPDWWQPGLPLAILGQAALTVGVALRLDWFGRSRR